MNTRGAFASLIADLEAEIQQSFESVEKQIHALRPDDAGFLIEQKRLVAEANELRERFARAKAFHVANNYCPVCFICRGQNIKLQSNGYCYKCNKTHP